jgi:ribonucleoside-diphosphate reductase alpha chain
VFGVEGYGCEPVFALAYYRNVYQSAGGHENLKLTYTSPSFKEALDETSLDDETKKAIIDEIILKGSVQHVDQAPESIKEVFVVSADIKPKEHIMMQASIQAYIDNSISKTCNFPKEAGVEDVKEVYELAWKLKCKGLTVYVTGSREEVVLETRETAQKKTMETTPETTIVAQQNSLFAHIDQDIKRPRPGVVIGRTHQIDTPFGKAFVTVNRNSETGRMPFEVFVNIGKAGSDSAAFSEALGRLISGWLRSSSDPDKALEEVSEQLSGIGGSTSVGFGPNRVSSIPDAIAKVLRAEMELSKTIDQVSFDKRLTEADHTQPAYAATSETPNSKIATGSSLCPECGNFSVIETEGCIKCLSCAYSRC